MTNSNPIALLKGVARNLKESRWLAVLAGIFVLGAVFSFLSPVFLQMVNIQNIIVQAAATGIMAIGMTFVIMTAGIDISVGGILYLALVIGTKLALAYGDQAPSLIYFVAIGLGCLMGLINGLIINFIKINPLITTLATLNIYRGLAIHITKAAFITPPASARFLGIGKIANIPMPMIISIAVTIIGMVILQYTRFGRYALAVGSSSRSARESGLPTRSVLIIAYVIAGICAGLGGMVLIGRVGNVQTDIGIGVEFTVITAVVLGGTLLSGGRASMLGSLLGAIFLVMIDNGLNLIHASAFIYDVVRGAVLIGAVLIDRAATVNLLKNFKIISQRQMAER
jgi:ribose transport system permease protein